MNVATQPNSRNKRMFRKRLIAFLIVHGVIGLHLILWYAFDWTLIGALEMQDLFRSWIEKNILTAGALFFAVFIIMGLLWGRLFCGWMCHIGQTYDLLAELFGKIGLKMSFFPLRFGSAMTWVILIWYFLWEAILNRSTAPPGEIQVAWGATTPWELLPGWANGIITLGIVLFVLPILLGRRTFCRMLCPWGALFGMANRISLLKIRRTGECTMCGLCDASCPMDVAVSREINTHFHVKSLSCTNCMACTAACPTSALEFSLPQKENRSPQKRTLLPELPYPSLWLELLFWTMTGLVGFIYAELYGIGIFLGFSIGLIIARLTWQAAAYMRPMMSPKRLAPILLIVFVWGIVIKDGVANFHYDRGRAAFINGDYDLAQNHYERSDALLWQTPNLLIYHLYIIYKSTGQEEKRETLYHRYEERRKKQGKI